MNYHFRVRIRLSDNEEQAYYRDAVDVIDIQSHAHNIIVKQIDDYKNKAVDAIQFKVVDDNEYEEDVVDAIIVDECKPNLIKRFFKFLYLWFFN